MPLPDVTVERCLAVDLELMHVHGFVEQLHDRFHHSRMAREPGERLAVQVRREIGAHDVALLFAHVFRTALRIKRGDFVAEHLDFLGPEVRREKQVAVTVEAFDLFRAEPHDGSPYRYGEHLTPTARDPAMA